MRARLATNQLSRTLTTTMHLLSLLPTGFLSVAKTTDKKSCTWFNGANPQSRSQRGKWSVFHSAQKALGRSLCEKDSWFFFFFITHFFPQECRSSDLFDGWKASLLFVAMVYGYIGRMLLPCGNSPKGMLAFRILTSTSCPLLACHLTCPSFAINPLLAMIDFVVCSCLRTVLSLLNT
jgi:hypothetical protein